MSMVLAMSPSHSGDRSSPHEDAKCEEQAAGVLNQAARPRRRFVRSGMTLYEHSFSRMASVRRSRRGAEPSTPAGARLQPPPASACASPRDEGELGPDAGVSSLSSVLDEVMNGRSCAVANFADAAAPAAPSTTYVVRRDADGTYYVASSDGQRYFADSAIGQVFLGSAPAAAAESAAAAAPKAFSPAASSTRRSDMDFVGSRGWQHVHALKRQSVGSGTELRTHEAGLRARVEEVEEEDGDEDDHWESAAPVVRPKPKVFQLGSAVKRRVQSVKHRGVSRFSRRSDAQAGIDDVDIDVDVADAAVLGGHEAMLRPGSREEELPMLDAAFVDTRGRGDSSWEVPAAPANAATSPVTTVAGNTAKDTLVTSAEELERGRGSSDWELAPPEASASEDAAATASPAFPPRKLPIQPLPRLQLREEKVDALATLADNEEDDEEVNELTQSFRNVRDIDLVAPRASSFDEDSEQPRESSLESDNSGSSSASDHNSTAVAPAISSNTNSATYAGRSSGSLDFGSGRIRVSSSGTSIADFVGGYKSHVSRRPGMGMGLGGPNASAFVSRSRSLRHGRKSPAAQSTPATELGRKLRDARNRIPVEFRDELTPQPKKKRRDGAKSVRFNPTPFVREFEVEDEDEDECAKNDGGEPQEPDEIVDAVQLVAKNEVLHAEELFLQDEPDLMFEMSSSNVIASASVDRPPEVDIDDSSDDPLAFSELRVDKPLDIADL